jgi:nucleoside-diphosphate-sugar epimerase
MPKYFLRHPPPEDMERRMADLTRLKKLTGYAPKFSLDKILQDVIADIRKQLGTQDRLSYTTV